MSENGDNVNASSAVKKQEIDGTSSEIPRVARGERRVARQETEALSADSVEPTAQTTAGARAQNPRSGTGRPRAQWRPKNRARINSSDLLLQETHDGLIISPALHRQRKLGGLEGLVPSLRPGGSSRSLVPSQSRGGAVPLPPSKKSTVGKRNDGSHDRHKGAGNPTGGGKESGVGNYKPRLERMRSSTLDEHGIKAQQEERMVKRTSVGRYVHGRHSASVDKEGKGGRKQRTRSHDGPLEKDMIQRARPSAEWAHLDAFQAMGSLFQQELYHEKSSGIVEVLADRIRVPLLIVLVGILAALVGMTVVYVSNEARLWRISWVAAYGQGKYQWLIYGMCSLSLTLSMCAVTHYICPSASGGGVPEMKAVLSGGSRPGLLSGRLVVVKIMGVIVANAAGLSVGKEGPLIHITCAMADILMSAPAFKQVRLNTNKRLEILACACAAGVAATFGSIFGGTLFSVEVTATAYMVATLPATFLCAVVVVVVYWMSGNSELLTLISDKTVQAQGFTGADLVAWSILGVVCGLVGAGFVAALDTLSRRRNYFTRKDLPDSTRKLRMFVVVGLCTLIVIPGAFMEAVCFTEIDPRTESGWKPLVDQMYTQKVFGVSWHLVQLLGLKLWTTIFSVVQPLPVGLFSPVFVIGGLMGRIFGELARWIDPFFVQFDINFEPWEFALIGSAAFSAGVTRAVSTAVIVFELSGENHLRLPLGVALMISYFIANRFTKGVYDALMDTNGTPYLQEVSLEDRNVPAEDVMVPVEDIPCLSLGSTGKDAAQVALSSQPGQVIPIVQSMSDKVLVGVVLWNDLAIALADYRRRGSSMLHAAHVNYAAATSEYTRGQDYGHHLLGSPNAATAAAAAASIGADVKVNASKSGERGGDDAISPPGSLSGSQSAGQLFSWPKLAAVSEAVRGRVKWLPRVRMAEAALLDQLGDDVEEALEREDDSEYEEGGGEGSNPPSSAPSLLPPLGAGIPYTPSANVLSSLKENAVMVEDGGCGDKGGGSGTRDEKSPLLRRSANPPPQSRDSKHTGDGKDSTAAAAADETSPASSWRGNSYSYSTNSGSERSPTLGDEGGRRRAGMDKANRAALRFYLVREGHKFVPVGRTGRSEAWHEMATQRSDHGIPVVLDPSPYQVTHTTELAKVDMAFRLLRLENAYVCNAGRLVGVITRDSLRAFMGLRGMTSPIDEWTSLFSAFSCCDPRRLTHYNSISSDSSNSSSRSIDASANEEAAASAADRRVGGKRDSRNGSLRQRRIAGSHSSAGEGERSVSGGAGPGFLSWLNPRRRTKGYSSIDDGEGQGEGESIWQGKHASYKTEQGWDPV